MRALIFAAEGHTGDGGVGATPGDPRLATAAALLRLVDMPPPRLPRPDWVLVAPRLTGICGSEAKQAFLDYAPLRAPERAGSLTDNPMKGFISFPHVLGHEVVGTVVETGAEARGLSPGDRVVLNPWLTCAPRGVDPVCGACAAGDLSQCWSFDRGGIAPGMHIGLCRDVPGGFAELMAAHDSMWHPVPDGLSDEAAVLADPFAVSLHAVTRHAPAPGNRVLVYGAGALGCCAVAILAALHPDVEVGCVARWDAQRRIVAALGARVFEPEPRDALIEELVAWAGGRLWPADGLPMALPAGIDVVYDTVGAPETLEVGCRVLRTRGTLVKLGMDGAARWEDTPVYFKELTFTGSNAFGVEEVEGRRAHGIAHYLDLAAAGRVDLAGMVTHTFPLDAWPEAFGALADQARSGAIKVAFDQR